MRRFVWVLLVLLTLSCSRVWEEVATPSYPPDGTPVTIMLGFGSKEMLNMEVATKAEASEADEARIHDMYVFIFDGNGNKVYGRFFSYEHLSSSLSALDSNPNEGWWVENKTLPSATSPVAETTGAVKVSTQTSSNSKVIVIANIKNAVSSFNENLEDIAYLNGIGTLSELYATRVKLEQDIVNRKDLFLMTGTLDVTNTASMKWGDLTNGYDSDYTIQLKAVDAKVKFLVKYNTTNIRSAKAVYWQVCSTPDQCYLFGSNVTGFSGAPQGTNYFDSEQAYFEGVETVDGDEWYAFTFYMLENKQSQRAAASSYHDRERQEKNSVSDTGYGGDVEEHFVKNGDWLYARNEATYVKFDMILTLEPAGINAMGAGDYAHALTSDTIFTVHLGDFGNSDSGSTHNYDDYNTLRGCFYTYKITINNTGSIFAEVENDVENQPGQEGYLLLTNDEVVNADCHYEYRSIAFYYDPSVSPDKFSWYVKTPFGDEGGPTKGTEIVGGVEYPVYTADNRDYKWVKFAVNEDNGTNYYTRRRSYPGDSNEGLTWSERGSAVYQHYFPDWKPSMGPKDADQLLDINQLIEYIFDETRKEQANQSSDFKTDIKNSGTKSIRATIYIDEYYYEYDPFDPDKKPDPSLWVKFVNAKPREMHILSDDRQSRDRQSDVIHSSHSIIQQSIQTIYNIYSPGLRSLWGTEHKDEIKDKKDEHGNRLGDWPYWPANLNETARAGTDDAKGRENGRLNTAKIWGTFVNNSDVNTLEWDSFVNFDVDNDIPELADNYHGMAFSCLIRNRDNNGNGIIDREEVRWYLAASEQLIGMWVGNESLSLSARLYQPSPGEWRSHVVSSTAQKVCWAEEGGGATDLYHDWDGPNSDYHTWASQALAAKGESVRCLRNIGTFEDAGVTKDVSEAPYDYIVDRYFTIDPDPSGSVGNDVHYTFHFDRLDTKSIREYSAGELPYHDQNSLNNRVYVKMITQSRGEDVDFESVKFGDINPRITMLGNNPYCPEGYRIPNHTEWVLMSLYLSANYLKKNKNGGNYSNLRMPTRTYYDRGYYGKLKDENAAWGSEATKVGWVFSDKLHCVAYNVDITHTRCVKDDETMIGNISGAIDLEGLRFHPSETHPIQFNVSSVASAFSAAELKLCYTNPRTGNYREIDIPVVNTPKGLQYRKSQDYQIPDLGSLGLQAEDLPLEMSLVATVYNVSGKSGTFSTDFVLSSRYGGTVTILDDFDPDNGFPIKIEAVSDSDEPIKNVTLRWKQHGDDHYTEQTVFSDSGSILTEKTVTAYWKPSWMTDSSDVLSDNSQSRKYYFSAIVGGDSDEGLAGKNDRADDAEMEFYKINYNPNPGNWAWNNKPTVKWYAQAITGLNFSNGDFVDAFLDVSNCTYDPKKPGTVDNTNDLGMDNILTVAPQTNGTENGQGLLQWSNGNVLIYYPARNGENNNVQIAVHANSSISRVQPFALDAGKLKVLFKRVNNKGLLLVNNYNPKNEHEPDWVNEEVRTYSDPMAANTQAKLDALTNGNNKTIYVASTEGSHRSRAVYKYVRAVRR